MIDRCGITLHLRKRALQSAATNAFLVTNVGTYTIDDRCRIALHLISADTDTFGVTDLSTWLDIIKATLLADGSRGAVFGAAIVDGAFRTDSAI